jgi:hypothetical protein
MEQRRIGEKCSDGLDIRYLFGATADDLSGLDQPAEPAGLPAGGSVATMASAETCGKR